MFMHLFVKDLYLCIHVYLYEYLHLYLHLYVDISYLFIILSYHYLLDLSVVNYIKSFLEIEYLTYLKWIYNESLEDCNC